MTDNEEELLEAVAKDGLIELPHLKLVWASLNHEINKRLIQAHKPVDFDSFTVTPCPYRGNWENHLLTMFPSLGPSLRTFGENNRYNVADRMGVVDEMSNSAILACKRGLIYWTLRVKPNRRWWSRMVRAEQRRLKALGSAGYLNLVAQEVHRLKRYFLNYVYSWIGETSLPCAAARYSPKVGGHFLAEYVPPNKMAKDNWEVRARGGVVRRNRVLNFSGQPLQRSPPPSRLPEVPNLLEGNQDVRDGGPQ